MQTRILMEPSSSEHQFSPTMDLLSKCNQPIKDEENVFILWLCFIFLGGGDLPMQLMMRPWKWRICTFTFLIVNGSCECEDFDLINAALISFHLSSMNKDFIDARLEFMLTISLLMLVKHKVVCCAKNGRDSHIVHIFSWVVPLGW